MPPLKNLRHETFCLEYLKDRNGERAYLASGYHAKACKDGSSSASACASSLLKRVKVKNRLKELIDRAGKRLEITSDRVLQEMGRLAFSDIRQALGPNGEILDPASWDDHLAGAVAGIETEKLFEGKGKDRTFIGYTQKLKLWDKNTALTNLAKHFKLLEADPVGGDVYNTQFNFYLPTNPRDVNPEHVAHATGNGHTNGSGNGTS